VTLLVLWRHGQTAWNAERRIQGQTDIELTDVGLEQARLAAPRLAALKPTVLISSDLKRASRTQAALAGLVHLPVTYDQRLRERSFGDWEGLTHPEITARWPESFARWRHGEPVDDAAVEEVDTLSKRMLTVLQETVDAAPPGAVIVAATHGAAARYATCALLGWPAEVAPTLGPLHNCHSTQLQFDGVRGWQLLAHNLP
jgi:broad specificity phosphatase PhoE